MNNAAKCNNPWISWQQSLVDETSAALGRMTHLPTLWRRVRRIRKGVTPCETVYEEDRLQLRHYLS